MIDSHCHLDAFVRNDELDAVLERAAAAGVNAFVAAGTNAEDREVYRGRSSDPFAPEIVVVQTAGMGIYLQQFLYGNAIL